MEGVDKRKRATAVENLGYQASVKLALINLNRPELKINIRDVRTYPLNKNLNPRFKHDTEGWSLGYLQEENQETFY